MLPTGRSPAFPHTTKFSNRKIVLIIPQAKHRNRFSCVYCKPVIKSTISAIMKSSIITIQAISGSGQHI